MLHDAALMLHASCRHGQATSRDGVVRPAMCIMMQHASGSASGSGSDDAAYVTQQRMLDES